jgi:hypothetical protein
VTCHRLALAAVVLINATAVTAILMPAFGLRLSALLGLTAVAITIALVELLGWIGDRL